MARRNGPNRRPLWSPSASAGLTACFDLVWRRAAAASTEVRALLWRIQRASGVSLGDLLDHAGCESEGQVHAIQVDCAQWSDALFLMERSACQKLDFACRVDSVDDFVRAHELASDEDACLPYGPFRKQRVFDLPGMSLSVVERHGWRGCSPPQLKARETKRARIHKQVFRTRQREFRTDVAGLATLSRLATAAETEIGREWTAALFLQAEVEFWMSRCEAGRVQHARQSQAGLGWSPLRQLAYACSRESFHRSRALFERLGFSRASVAHAHGAAIVTLRPAPGFGLPEINLVVDSDGDDRFLSDDAYPPSPLTSIGPAGLWCALYGQSLLTAGPIAAQAACAPRDDLLDEEIERPPRAGVGNLTPVDPRRVRALEERKFIGAVLGERLRLVGSAGPRFLSGPCPPSELLRYEAACLETDAVLRSSIALPRLRRRRRRSALRPESLA